MKCENCGRAFAEGEVQRQDISTRVTVNVCPKCHILFFDGFAYAVLKGLKA